MSSKMARRPEREVSMKDGLNQVWQAIGCDVLQGVGEGDESVTMTGAEVGAIVADHVDTYIPTEKLKAEWRAGSYEQHQVWLREAFPEESLYGF